MINFRLTLIILSSIAVLLLFSEVQGQQRENQSQEKDYYHSIEIFPIVALFKIYSVQYTYAFTPKDHFIIGAAYVNITVEDRHGNEIGRFHAPTIPIGYRRFIWKNLHVEYQLWPGYNMYYEKNEKKYYNGFDLYNEFRAGYKFDVRIGTLPFFVNLQYVFGFGLYPGNKPDSYIERSKEIPIFHAPTIAIGVRF